MSTYLLHDYFKTILLEVHFTHVISTHVRYTLLISVNAGKVMIQQTTKADLRFTLDVSEGVDRLYEVDLTTGLMCPTCCHIAIR